MKATVVTLFLNDATVPEGGHHQIVFRVSHEHHRQFVEAAGKLGLSLTGFMRTVLVQTSEKVIEDD